MTTGYDWRGDVGDVWAEEWRRTDRSLAPVNAALVAEAAAGQAGKIRILDIGCGAGATSLALADALGEADITGIDLSESLVAVARTRAAGNDRVRFEVADATSWAPAEAGFDLIVSRHGVMFFEDPQAAFAHIGALARPGARLVFSCFRGRADNEWVRAMRPVFERFAPEALAAPDPPAGPFAFADAARIESILNAAGFAAPQIAPLDFAFTVGGGADPVEDAVGYFRRVGPFAALLRTLDGAVGAAATDMLAAITADHRSNGEVAFGGAAWIVTSTWP
jgi:SAM-dependent methyltransferase